jgi:hypothetical protein
MIPRIGEWVKTYRNPLWAGVCMLLTGWSAYNLGLLHAQNGGLPAQEAVVFRETAVDVPRRSSEGQGSRSDPARDDPRVVVSKSSSSKKYHHAWCPGASQIKESNRLWFPTSADAEAAGYSLAGNCAREYR